MVAPRASLAAHFFHLTFTVLVAFTSPLAGVVHTTLNSVVIVSTGVVEVPFCPPLNISVPAGSDPMHWIVPMLDHTSSDFSPLATVSGLATNVTTGVGVGLGLGFGFGVGVGVGDTGCGCVGVAPDPPNIPPSIFPSAPKIPESPPWLPERLLVSADPVTSDGPRVTTGGVYGGALAPGGGTAPPGGGTAAPPGGGAAPPPPGGGTGVAGGTGVPPPGGVGGTRGGAEGAPGIPAFWNNL